MRRYLHIILLAHFVVYAHSTFVMWTLFLVEQHDIIVYYEHAGDRSGGTRYMERLSGCDNTSSRTAMGLVLMNAHDAPFAQSSRSIILTPSSFAVIIDHAFCGAPMGFAPPPPSKPPRA